MKRRNGQRDSGLRDEEENIGKSCWQVEGYSDNKVVRWNDKNLIAVLLPENTSKPLIYSGFRPRLMQFSEPVICDIDRKRRCLKGKKLLLDQEHTDKTVIVYYTNIRQVLSNT